MMDLQTIREITDNATMLARHHKLAPYTHVEGQKVAIPMLGRYVHEDWERVAISDFDLGVDRFVNEDDDGGTLFIDMSGFGSPDDPAMQMDAFVELVEQNPDLGFGTIEYGQFQGFIGVYRYIK
jgi:hypothetical protein